MLVWTVWHTLEEETAVVVITDVVMTESVVAAAVVTGSGTAVNGPQSSNGIASSMTSFAGSWWVLEDFAA